jgi:hypothetical protein
MNSFVWTITERRIAATPWRQSCDELSQSASDVPWRGWLAMSTSLIPVNLQPDESKFVITEAQTIIHRMVLDSVQSNHFKRNYAKALNALFAFCANQPLFRALLMDIAPECIISHRPQSTPGYLRYESLSAKRDVME